MRAGGRRKSDRKSKDEGGITNFNISVGQSDLLLFS